MWDFARQASLPSSSCSFFCKPDSGPELALDRGASLPRSTDQTKKHQNYNIQNASSKWHVWCKLLIFRAQIFFGQVAFCQPPDFPLASLKHRISNQGTQTKQDQGAAPSTLTLGHFIHQFVAPTDPNLPASTIFGFDVLPPWVATFAFALAHGCK